MYILLGFECADEESSKVLNGMIPVETFKRFDDDYGIRFEHPVTGVSRDVVSRRDGTIIISEAYNNDKITEPRENFRYCGKE
jgi:hypothetical protein